MLLPDAFAYSLAKSRNGSISGLRFYCDSCIVDEVKKYFNDTFQLCWKDALMCTEDVYGDEPGSLVTEIPVPINKITDTEYGFFVSLDSFEVECGNWECHSAEYTADALEDVLKVLKKEFKNRIKYDGYICYTFENDGLGTEIIQNEISSRKNNEKNKTYDFIGKIMGNLLSDNDDEDDYYESDDFWECLSERLSFYNECSDELSLMGILKHEYDKDEKYEIFIEFINAFFVYKEWVDPLNLQQIISRIIEVFIEDGDFNRTKEELTDTAQRILSGEKIKVTRNEADSKSSRDALMANLYANQHNKENKESVDDFMEEYEKELLKTIKELGLD